MSLTIKNVNLESLLAKLRRGTLEEKAEALKQTREISHALGSAAVEALITSEAKYPIADRLVAFGSSIIDPLESAFYKTKDEDVKVLAATVLLRVGCRDQNVSNYLVEALKRGSPYLGIIAWVLGSCGIKEASEVLEDWLSKWDFVADPYTSASLIGALKQLGGDQSSILVSLRKQELPQNIKLALAS